MMISLQAVDRVEILSVMDNSIDVLMGSTPVAKRVRRGRDAHTRKAVNLAVRQALLQPFDHGPAVREGLKFGRRAQVTEERTAFVDRFQGQHGGEQVAFGQCFLPGGDVAVLFQASSIESIATELMY